MRCAYVPGGGDCSVCDSVEALGWHPDIHAQYKARLGGCAQHLALCAALGGLQGEHAHVCLGCTGMSLDANCSTHSSMHACLHVQHTMLQMPATGAWFTAQHMPANKAASAGTRELAVNLHDAQVAVDISTPPEAFEAVDKAVDAHLKSMPTEYTGTRLVVANYAGDPLKYTLCVWWAPLSRRLAGSCLLLHFGLPGGMHAALGGAGLAQRVVENAP